MTVDELFEQAKRTLIEEVIKHVRATASDLIKRCRAVDLDYDNSAKLVAKEVEDHSRSQQTQKGET